MNCVPKYTVAVQGRPQASVATLGRPAVVSVTVPGPQGAAGQPGPRGVNTGFGQITYTNRSLEADDTFEPGVRAQVLFTPDVPTDNQLNTPFEDHSFWVNDAIVPRARGDLYDIQINLIVKADTIGGELRLDADVNSALGPIASDTQSLFEGAGVPERVTFRLRVQVLNNFLVNMCRLYLTSSVRVTTISETVLIAPVSLRPDTLPPEPEPPGTTAPSLYPITNAASFTAAHGKTYAPDVWLISAAGEEVESDVTHTPGAVTVSFVQPFTGTLLLR